MRSIWSGDGPRPPRPALAEDITADVAVIGAGMAGCLTAYHLQRAGLRTVVLEARTAGSGQTAGTTAKITCQHGLIYDRLIAQLGQAQARLYAQANQKAVGQFRTLIEEEGIDCGLETKPAILYTRRDPAALHREWSAAVQLGLHARLTAAAELPFPVAEALRFEDQAQFDPLRFLAAVAKGLTIYEHTPVLAVEGHRLRTERGTVTAGKIVFACHFPFVNAPGYYFARMHQSSSYVLALAGPRRLEGMYYGVDPGGYSIRTAGDVLLLGGGEHRTGENPAGGQYDRLRRAARAWWPGCVERAAWSAQDCMPHDGVPFIGPFSARRPDWYVATGFQKWGMTTSMAAAHILTDLISGRDNEYAPVFSPQRPRLRASLGAAVTDALTTAKALGRAFFAPARDAAADMPPGQGGIVEAGGKKRGLYWDGAGEHYVSVRCPHMGCELAWDPEEKTWECPCHGSRFDAGGALLSGPAQRGIGAEN